MRRISLKNAKKHELISMRNLKLRSQTGFAGTTISAIANKNNINNDKKGKNLNTSANILAGTSTVASAVSTGLNIAQLHNIKKIIEVASECSKALK